MMVMIMVVTVVVVIKRMSQYLSAEFLCARNYTVFYLFIFTVSVCLHEFVSTV